MVKQHVSSIVVMGVSGVGKSTLGVALADSLGWEFLEGDEYHPKENIEKMQQGQALEDEDRWAWLHRINRVIRQKQKAGVNTVLACSALKESYRNILRQDVQALEFVYLDGDFETIQKRLTSRTDHFMPSSLLKSQFDTLEKPRASLQVPIILTIDEQVQMITSTFALSATES